MDIVVPTLRPYSHQGLFRFWCQHVLPLVYDDSLSYYELLCKVIQYLNIVIEDVDTCETNITLLHDAFTALKDEVEDFEGNIEQKIEDTFLEMAQTGEIADLIRQAVNENAITNVYWSSTDRKIKQTKNGANIDVVEVLNSAVENSKNPVSSGALFNLSQNKADKATTVSNVFWNAEAQELRQDKDGVITTVLAILNTIGEGSHNPVSGGAIYEALQQKLNIADGVSNFYWDSVTKTIKKTVDGVNSDILTILSTITANSDNPVTSNAIYTALTNKINTTPEAGSVSSHNLTLTYYKFGLIVFGHFAGIPNTSDVIEFTLPWTLKQALNFRTPQWGGSQLTDIFGDANSNILKVRGHGTAGNYLANITLIINEVNS